MNNIQEIYSLVITLIALALVTYYFLDKQKDGDKLDNPEIKNDQPEIAQKNNDTELSELKSQLEKNYLEKEQDIRNEIESKQLILMDELKLQLRETSNQEEKELRLRINDSEKRLEEKKLILETKIDKIEEEKEKIEIIKDELRTIKKELLSKKDVIDEKEIALEKQYQSKIELLAKLSMEEAKDNILQLAKTQMGGDLLTWQHKMLESAEENANLKAREIVALAIQRCSSEVANEFTITTVKLDNDDDKGKIIGKAGRNIQWLEKTLGVELVIDETPEIMTISGFSSIRRHIAKRTIEKLLEDGRIHPASIEDMHEKAKAEIAQEIAEAGQWAVNELGIIDFPAKLVRIIGRLKFRTSYGQNMLKHSVEMAKLAGLIAGEMSQRFPNTNNPINIEICIKGALLHDIGKAVDEETQPKGNHIDLGERVCDSFGLDWKIRKCISSHHDESYYDPENGFCIEAAIVDACDNISGGRPGGRKDTAEAYYQRMESLEKIGENTPGVNKCWIMRGSRELWVFFDTTQVTPIQMHEATREIANRIQTEVKYPGEIKIVGIWEDKLIEYAA